jgi:hypothetical protein
VKVKRSLETVVFRQFITNYAESINNTVVIEQTNLSDGTFKVTANGKCLHHIKMDLLLQIITKNRPTMPPHPLRRPQTPVIRLPLTHPITLDLQIAISLSQPTHVITPSPPPKSNPRQHHPNPHRPHDRSPRPAAKTGDEFQRDCDYEGHAEGTWVAGDSG